MTPELDVKEAAEWLRTEIARFGYWAPQRQIAYAMRAKFGEESVYRNKNFNFGIVKPILAELKRISKDEFVWSRSQQAWRKREPDDGPSRMVR